MTSFKTTSILSLLLAITFASTVDAAWAEPNSKTMAKVTGKATAKEPVSEQTYQSLARSIIVVPDEPPPDWASDRLVALAACYKNMGAPERAKKALRLAIKNDKKGKIKKDAQMLLDSELPKYTVPQEAVFLSNKAYDHFCRKEYASAIRVAKDCIAKYPKYESPLDTLSVIYLQQHKPQLARETSMKALAINNKCSNAWLSLGNSYLMEGDYKKARAAAEKSLQCYPHNMNTKAMIAFLNAKHR